mmetsp:Transcript_3585/g.3535  ORF Transcript_3585/g.3535 Transcript_3585/m.3535 type:complete len:108 (+) Transcript_3585:374-697(+)
METAPAASPHQVEVKVGVQFGISQELLIGLMSHVSAVEHELLEGAALADYLAELVHNLLLVDHVALVGGIVDGRPHQPQLLQVLRVARRVHLLGRLQYFLLFLLLLA